MDLDDNDFVEEEERELMKVQKEKIRVRAAAKMTSHIARAARYWHANAVGGGVGVVGKQENLQLLRDRQENGKYCIT